MTERIPVDPSILRKAATIVTGQFKSSSMQGSSRDVLYHRDRLFKKECCTKCIWFGVEFKFDRSPHGKREEKVIITCGAGRNPIDVTAQAELGEEPTCSARETE